ncbi:unnamed protein product [Rhizoctonia solani]|uniref:Uncharacterized protein n=1 Tax=Rhizoctonia solani TaxID=456999 RepID=A0A8H3CQN1_9AGAM|nr:unnamed protein product [Rhizoctonia solani]
MSSKQETINIGSGTDEHRSPGTPVFLVVEHNGRKVGIGRNSNYQETIASIKKNVQGLKTTPDDQVVMLAFLEEVDDHVQITEEIWADLLPRLVKVRVEVGSASHSPPASPSTRDKLENELPARGWASSGDANIGKEATRAQEDDTKANHEQQEVVRAQLGYGGGYYGYVPPHLRDRMGWSDQSPTRPTDNDDFQVVPGQKKWRPSRGRGGGW